VKKNMRRRFCNTRTIQTDSRVSQILVVHGGVELTVVKTKARTKCNDLRRVSSKMMIHAGCWGSMRVKGGEERSFRVCIHHSEKHISVGCFLDLFRGEMQIMTKMELLLNVAEAESEGTSVFRSAKVQAHAKISNVLRKEKRRWVLWLVVEPVRVAEGGLLPEAMDVKQACVDEESSMRGCGKDRERALERGEDDALQFCALWCGVANEWEAVGDDRENQSLDKLDNDREGWMAPLPDDSADAVGSESDTRQKLIEVSVPVTMFMKDHTKVAKAGFERQVLPA
jgi:hypothetical protein